MTTYVIAPGAWLAGCALHPHQAAARALHPHLAGSALHPHLAGSALHPHLAGTSALHPHQAAQSGLHPHLAGNSPLHPHPPSHESATGQYGSAQHPHVRPLRTQFWHGRTADWTAQSGDQALLAQALERSYARIARPKDPRAEEHQHGEMPAAADAPDMLAPLWRWGSEFRVHAVAADLAWRLRVQGCKLLLTRGGVLSLDLSAARLPADKFEGQIDKVQRAAIEREDRLPEILAQSDDLWSFFRVLLGRDDAASPIVAELLAVAWQWATPLVMALKNDVAALRPVHRAPSVLPVIATPAHGSLPSGHATMAALTAEVLSHLLFAGDDKHPRVQQLDRLARRIAFNRVVAGVHFPIDSAAGYALGLQLAGHFVGWATGKPAFEKFSLDPKVFSELSETSKKVLPKKQTKASEKSATLGLMWAAAVREVKRGGA